MLAANLPRSSRQYFPAAIKGESAEGGVSGDRFWTVPSPQPGAEPGAAGIDHFFLPAVDLVGGQSAVRGPIAQRDEVRLLIRLDLFAPILAAKADSLEQGTGGR